MINRQARALARIEQQYKTLKGKERREFEEYVVTRGPDQALAEFGRKTPERADLYGSVKRREEADKRAAAEVAKPVPSIFSAGAGYLNLRPIAERVERRANEDHTEHVLVVGERVECTGCGKPAIELYQKHQRRLARGRRDVRHLGRGARLLGRIPEVL